MWFETLFNEWSNGYVYRGLVVRICSHQLVFFTISQSARAAGLHQIQAFVESLLPLVSWVSALMLDRWSFYIITLSLLLLPHYLLHRLDLLFLLCF